jgi:aminoglycoside 2''-phosphotransferase
MGFPSAARARAAVRSLTSLPASDMVELGRGSDSVAFLVDGEWVFRFPAVQDAQATLRREIALLPRLGATLPLATPAFEHIGQSDGELLFVGYRVIGGAPLSVEHFEGLEHDAQEAALAALADFLQALHAFPLPAAREAGIREERGKGAYNGQQRHLHGDLGCLLSGAEIARLDGVFERYERDFAPDCVTPVLLHSDLKPAHVLYDTAAHELTGVLDWGDVCLGDPYVDLAVISMFFGERFLMRLLAHLPDRDPAVVLAKTQFFTTVRWLQDLAFDVERGDHHAAESCLRRLRDHVRACAA